MTHLIYACIAGNVQAKSFNARADYMFYDGSLYTYNYPLRLPEIQTYAAGCWSAA